MYIKGVDYMKIISIILLLCIFLFVGCSGVEEIERETYRNTEIIKKMESNTAYTDTKKITGTVDTENRAIEIARKFVQNKYQDDFSDYTIKVHLKDDYWIVYYSLNTKKTSEVIFGGGGPMLKIEKSTGKVKYCKLQK